MLLQGFHLRSAFLIWWPDNRGLEWRTRCGADLTPVERRVPKQGIQVSPSIQWHDLVCHSRVDAAPMMTGIDPGRACNQEANSQALWW